MTAAEPRIWFGWSWLRRMAKDALAGRRGCRPWRISRMYRAGYADALHDLDVIDDRKAKEILEDNGDE